MTALLAIDTATGIVRRYEPRRVGGRPLCTHEGVLVPSSPTLLAGIEAFRVGGFAHEAELPQDHLPAGAA
jgi:hypothetical protein